ncbi:MAG: T9SS type A sorting domain-containing protein [Ignavibacteriae bacterium]|nr:T9SS type A sorting domain-containing protein [Ignavibacteriota bacterium]
MKIVVYDVLGREISTLVNEYQLAGHYEVTFNAENLPSGIYYYTLKTNNYFETKKMILLK